QLRTAVDDEAAAPARTDPPQQDGLVFVHEVDELHVAGTGQQNVGVEQIRLFDRSVEGDREAQLAEMRAAVEGRPEEPLDLAPPRQAPQERPVAEACSRPRTA